MQLPVDARPAGSSASTTAARADATMDDPALPPIVMVSLAETLRLLQRELALTFPHVTFTVRPIHEGFGQWAGVTWTDGPPIADVRAVTDAYEGSAFNAVNDCETIQLLVSALGDGSIVRVHYGVRSITVTREISASLWADTVRRVLARCPDARSIPRATRADWLTLDDAELHRVTRAVEWDDWLLGTVRQALEEPSEYSYLWSDAAR